MCKNGVLVNQEVRTRMKTKDNWREGMKNYMKNLDLQVEMVEIEINEKKIHVDDHWNQFIASCCRP